VTSRRRPDIPLNVHKSAPLSCPNLLAAIKLHALLTPASLPLRFIIAAKATNTSGDKRRFISHKRLSDSLCIEQQQQQQQLQLQSRPPDGLSGDAGGTVLFSHHESTRRRGRREPSGQLVTPTMLNLMTPAMLSVGLPIGRLRQRPDASGGGGGGSSICGSQTSAGAGQLLVKNPASRNNSIFSAFGKIPALPEKRIERIDKRPGAQLLQVTSVRHHDH
jgi:hypothetical protein